MSDFRYHGRKFEELDRDELIEALESLTKIYLELVEMKSVEMVNGWVIYAN